MPLPKPPFSGGCQCGACRYQVTGAPRVWERPTDSGGRVACNFCPDCGTRLFHQGSAEPGNLSIKGGSLDDSPDLSQAFHIWTASKLPGVVIPPGATCYAQEPPD